VFQNRSGLLDDHFRLNYLLVDWKGLFDDMSGNSISVDHRLDFFDDSLFDGLLNDRRVDNLGSAGWSCFYGGRLNDRHSMLEVSKLSSFGWKLSFLDCGW